MMKPKPCDDATRVPKRGLPAEYYTLHSLLETLRACESHIDDVCGLLAEMQSSGKVSARTRREMAALVHAIPLNVMEADVAALHEMSEPAAQDRAA